MLDRPDQDKLLRQREQARLRGQKRRRRATADQCVFPVVADFKRLASMLIDIGELSRGSVEPTKEQIKRAFQRAIDKVLHRKPVTRDDMFVRLLREERSLGITERTKDATAGKL